MIIIAANTLPIFPVTPKVEWGGVAIANTNMDGTGTVVTVYTAGANGSRIDQIKVRASGTNVATVMRFFVNNGSDNSVAANNSLVFEASIAVTTASNEAAMTDNYITMTGGLCPIPYLPAGYKINITIGTSISGNLQCTVWGGDY